MTKGRRGNFRAWSGTALYGVAGLSGLPLSLLAAPLLATSLGTTGRGEYAVALLVNAFVAALVSAGVSDLVAFAAAKHFDTKRLMFLVSRASVAFGLTVCLVLLVPAILFEFTGASWFWLIIGSTATFQGIVAAREGLMRARSEYVRLSILRAAGVCATPVLVLLLGLSDFLTTHTALGAVAVSNLLVLISTVGLKGSTRFVSGPLKKREISKFLVYGQATGLARFIGGRVDQVVVAYALSLSELGVYSVAVTLSGVASTGAAAVALPAFRKASTSLEKADARYSLKVMHRWLLVSTLIGVIAAFIIYSISLWAIPVLFGDDFRGSERLLMFLLPSAPLGAATVVVESFGVAVGHPRAGFMAQLGRAAVSTLFAVVLVDSLGASGIAMAASAGAAAGLASIYIPVRDRLLNRSSF